MHSPAGPADDAVAAALERVVATRTVTAAPRSHSDSGGSGDVSFLPLSPASASASRAVPPSPALSASSLLSAPACPVVVHRSPACDALVLFDPTSQQLALYERRTALRPAVPDRPRRFLYLPPAPSSPPPSAPAHAATYAHELRARRKRKFGGVPADRTAERASLCPTCHQPWPPASTIGQRVRGRRHSDSVAVTAQRAAADSRSGSGTPTPSYTVTELDDDEQQQQARQSYGRGRDQHTSRAPHEAAEAAEAEEDEEDEYEHELTDDASAVDSGSTARGELAPFTSSDYFHLLSYTFLREQRQRQARHRLRRSLPLPLSAAQLLAIEDGDAVSASTGAADELEQQVDQPSHPRSPIEDADNDTADALSEVVRRAPHRLRLASPALLTEEVIESEHNAGISTGTSSGSDGSQLKSGDGVFNAPSNSPRSSATLVDSAQGGVGCVDSSSTGGLSGLQSSSFVTGYYDRFFVRVRKLGGGAFGSVYLTCHVLEGVELGHYACKIIPVGDSKPWLHRVVAEVRALESVHHQHVVSYRHSWLEMAQVADFGPPVPCLFLLMQYCDLGTVAQLVWPVSSRHSPTSQPASQAAPAATGADQQREQVERIRAERRSVKREKVSDEAFSGSTNLHAAPSAAGDEVVYLLESDVWWIFLDTCLGLRHLHRCGMLHMDLKLDNLLLTADRDARGRVQGSRVLLSDMGNAIIKGEVHQRTGNTGTIQYAAPETLLDPQQQQRQQAGTAGGPPGDSADVGSAGFAYSEKSDLWSLGVCLYCLCYSALPYEADTPQQLHNSIHTQPLHIPAHPRRSHELVALITALLSVDPGKRPDCEAILAHPHIRRRREERQSSMRQQQRQHRSYSGGPQRADWTAAVREAAQPASSVESTNQHYAATDQTWNAEEGRDQYRDALIVRQAPTVVSAHNEYNAPWLGPQSQAASAVPEQRGVLSSAEQGGSDHWVAKPLTHSVDHNDAGTKQVSAPYAHSIALVQHDSPSLALTVLRSKEWTTPLLPHKSSWQPVTTPSRLPPSADCDIARPADLTTTIANSREVRCSAQSEVAPKVLPSVSADVNPSVAHSHEPRSHGDARRRSMDLSSLLSARCITAVRGAELLAHLCVVSWCATSVSVASTPALAAPNSTIRLRLCASTPPCLPVLRALLLLPILIAFSLCCLSLTLTVLVPAPVVTSLLSTTPSLQLWSLSAAGRVWVALGMCCYALLLLTMLSRSA